MDHFRGSPGITLGEKRKKTGQMTMNNVSSSHTPHLNLFFCCFRICFFLSLFVWVQKVNLFATTSATWRSGRSLNQIKSKQEGYNMETGMMQEGDTSLLPKQAAQLHDKHEGNTGRET